MQEVVALNSNFSSGVFDCFLRLSGPRVLQTDFVLIHMLFNNSRLPPVMMARGFRLWNKMLPVLTMLIAAATASDFFVEANNDSSTASTPLLNTSNVAHNSRAQSLSNNSVPGTEATLRSSNGNDFDGGCKNCGVKPPPIKGSLEYNLRIEKIKRQILNKLHMDKEPRMKRPKMIIPTPLINANFLESESDDDEAKPSKTAQVIVIGTKVTSALNKKRVKKSRKLHYEFRFSSKIYSKAIPTATLWVYKQKRAALQMGEHTLRFEDYETKQSKKKVGSGTPISQDQTVVKKRIKGKDQGWISIDLINIVNQWIERALKKSTPNTTNYVHTLEVFCPDCVSSVDVIASRGQLRPFIVLDLADENRRPRRKRAINCRPRVKECCRQEFYVSFREMGWHNWVVAPRGFNANYCTGSCYGHILPVYHHTEVLQKVAILKTQRELSPCCSPTKMFGLSLIYFDKDENLFHENVPNMVVDECGCS